MSRQDIRPKHKIDIGLIVFIAIFLYIVFNSAMYMTREHISFFEVEQGDIAQEDSFNALILRSEQTMNSPVSGYVNFYVNNAERSAKNESVCLIKKSATNKSSAADADKTYNINDSDYSEIKEQMQHFVKSYSDSDYFLVQDLRYELGNVVSKIVSRENIGTMIPDKISDSYSMIASTQSGIISYTSDNMEGIKPEDVTKESFDTTKYEKVQLEAGSYVKADDPLFRIIYEDDWNLAISLSQQQYEQVEKLIDDYVEENKKENLALNITDAIPRQADIAIRFTKENIETKALIKTFERDGDKFALISLSEYMVRFCSDRFTELELIWNKYSGLKVPVSSIAKRDYYMIPSEFMVKADESSQEGFYTDTATGVEFIKPVIAYKSEDYCYVDCSDLQEGLVLKNGNNGKTYSLSSKAALEGVYTINQGYTKFCLVNVLYSYGDYSIIENTGNAGTVAIYDRVVLDGDSVDNNEVVY